MGTKEGGYVCAKLHCTLADVVPSKWAESGAQLCIILQTTSLEVRKVDEQGMEKVNVSRKIYKQN